MCNVSVRRLFIQFINKYLDCGIVAPVCHNVVGVSKFWSMGLDSIECILHHILRF